MFMNTDIDDFKFLVGIGKLFGFYSNSNLNFALHLIIYGIIIIWNLASLIYQAKALYPLPENMSLALINTITANLFLSYSFIESTTNRRKWLNLFKKVTIFDRGEKFKNFTSKKRFYFIQLFHHVTFIIVMTFWCYWFIIDFPKYNIFTQPQILCLDTVICHYKATWLALVMNQMTSMLEARYSALEATLKNILENNQKVGVYKRIKLAQYRANLLFDCVQYINSIFGVSLLILTVFSLVKSLYASNNVLFCKYSNLSQVLHSLSTTLICIQIIVFATLVVQGCDRVEKRYEKILVTCNVMQCQVSDNVLREELIILLNYMKNLSPKFTAAGFFQLNQNFFSKFLSVLVSYLIIIVQFKTTNIT